MANAGGRRRCSSQRGEHVSGRLRFLIHGRAGRPGCGKGGNGRAVMPPPLRVATVMPELIPHVTVEIHDTAGRRLVTAIEVLSPTDKRGDGREEYLAKRRRTLLSTAHLLEVDLLRSGSRVPMPDRCRRTRTSFSSAVLKCGRKPRRGPSGSTSRCRACRCRCWRAMPTCRWTLNGTDERIRHLPVRPDDDYGRPPEVPLRSPERSNGSRTAASRFPPAAVSKSK